MKRKLKCRMKDNGDVNFSEEDWDKSERNVRLLEKKVEFLK